MCHVSNLQTTTKVEEFDQWFESLKGDFIQTNDVSFDELLKQDTAYPQYQDYPLAKEFPAFQQQEFSEYPSPQYDYPSPKSLQAQTPKELPQTVAPPQDLSLKRKRQNEAAKRCRQKKLNQLQESQLLVSQYEKEKFEMAVRLAVLEKEKVGWLQREKQLNSRILALREQLDESHLVLMKINAAK